MKKKQVTKKINLKKETISALQSESLQYVLGGQAAGSSLSFIHCCTRNGGACCA